MNDCVKQELIQGVAEAVDQLTGFIVELDDDIYSHNPSPVFTASIGQHLRHILDTYRVLMYTPAGSLLDFDQRRRGHKVEISKNLALDELRDTRHWLAGLQDKALLQRVKVKGEVSICSKQVVTFNSDLGRELYFVLSHQIHHMAIMASIARFLGRSVEAYIGTAPSTASYIRCQASCISD